jgi:hypothetical protein
VNHLLAILLFHNFIVTNAFYHGRERQRALRAADANTRPGQPFPRRARLRRSRFGRSRGRRRRRRRRRLGARRIFSYPRPPSAPCLFAYFHRLPQASMYVCGRAHAARPLFSAAVARHFPPALPAIPRRSPLIASSVRTLSQTPLQLCCAVARCGALACRCAGASAPAPIPPVAPQSSMPLRIRWLHLRAPMRCRKRLALWATHRRGLARAFT